MGYLSNENVFIAKMKELGRCKKNKVYEEARKAEQKLLFRRLIITEKIKDNSNICNEKLAVRGFEEQNEDSIH